MNYDTSEKMRVPAYCDRILFKGDRILPKNYSRLECKMSDHRAVFATFVVAVSTINPIRVTDVERECSGEVDVIFNNIARERKINWICKALDVGYEEASRLLSQVGDDLSISMNQFSK
jgi:hypothetical protein